MHFTTKWWLSPSYIILLSIFYSFSVNGQGSASSYLYVYPSDPSAFPDAQGGVSNNSLQNILDSYQVVAYNPSFPSTSRPSLQNCFEIHCDGDPNALQNSLVGTGLYSFIEVTPYMELASCEVSCANPFTVNDSHYQFDITETGCAWNITRGDPSIVIGVADAMFPLNNNDLNDGQMLPVWGANNTNNHGGLVAGMIVATPDNNFGTAGLAPDLKVAGYSVPTNPSGGGNPWPGIWQAFLDGRPIINVSWTGAGISGGSYSIVEAIREITENGTIVVVAAGNGNPGQSTGHDAYADIPGVIMVSSVSSDGSVHQWVDYNEHVDLCAPGNGVGSIYGTPNWGTSNSAPAVSAAAGLILSVNGCLPPAEVEHILEQSACPMQPHPMVQPDWVGAGYLNIYQALLMAQGRSGVLSQDETWEDEVYVSDDLIVGAGRKLTIKGTVKFSESAQLIILPGGRVNLHGTLTNSCTGAWEGVLVEGLPSESQHTSGMHGKMYAYSGSLIENAVTGIELKDGGMFFGTEAKILNCGTGVYFHPFNNFWPHSYPTGQQGQPRSYRSAIKDCFFAWDDNFSSAEPINAGVEMLEVNGLRIRGCSFKNERNIKNPTSVSDYGYGVKSTDAQFSVISLPIGNTYPPSGYKHSLFEGLGYGVYTGTAQPGTNSTPTQADDFVNAPYKVHQATFTSCIYGIHNRFVSQGEIAGNNFQMGDLPPADAATGNIPFVTTQVGVFLEDGANGFELQENKFSKMAGNVNVVIGSYSKNLGWFSNVIRKNEYLNVDLGNIADENNARADKVTGLRYICNNNSTTSHDFFVHEQSDIHFFQYDVDDFGDLISAGNIFTRMNSPTGDFLNNGAVLNYYYNSSTEEPVYHAGITLVQTIENDCPTKIFLPPYSDETDQTQAQSDLIAKYNAGHSEYEATMVEMTTSETNENEADYLELVTEASQFRTELDKITSVLSLHAELDTMNYDLFKVRKWWKRMDTYIAQLTLTRDYAAKGQLDSARHFLSQIPEQYELTPAELTDLVDFEKILEIMQDKPAISIGQNEIGALLPIADQGRGVSSAWAKNILTVHGYHYPPVIKPFKSPKKNTNAKNAMGTDKNYTLEGINVYPNPVRNLINFSLPNRQGQDFLSYRIELFDGQGRQVLNREVGSGTYNLEISSLSPGPYYYRVTDLTAQGTYSGRVIVSR